MLSDRNSARKKSGEPDLNREKIENVESILEIICREHGEEEYETIVELKDSFDIDVTSEEVEELRGRNMWIWVLFPLDKAQFAQIESKIRNYSLSESEFLTIVSFNGVDYIKYPIREHMCAIHKDIFEVMSGQYDVSDNYMSFYEWEYVQKSDLWKSAEVQVARELIADYILKKLSWSSKNPIQYFD